MPGDARGVPGGLRGFRGVKGIPGVSGPFHVFSRGFKCIPRVFHGVSEASRRF